VKKSKLTLIPRILCAAAHICVTTFNVYDCVLMWAGLVTVPEMFFSSLPLHIGLQYTLFPVSNHVILLPTSAPDVSISDPFVFKT